MSIKIHFYLLMVLSYMYYIGNLELFIIFYISILLHEMAHIIVALLLKVDVTELMLMPVGVCAFYNEDIKPKKEIFISLAGPFMSFILSIFCKDILISNINLSIMIMNLIPIYPLDGGRIQKSYFSLKYGVKKGIQRSQIISDFFLMILFLFAIIFIIYFKNYYLLIVSLYIYTLSRKEMKKERILRLINYLQTD